MRKSKVLVCNECDIGLLSPFDEYDYCACYYYDSGQLNLYLYSDDLKLIIKLSKLLQMEVLPTISKGCYRG